MTYILTHNIKQKKYDIHTKNTHILHILIIPSIPSMPELSKCHHTEPIMVPLDKPSGPWIVLQ